MIAISRGFPPIVQGKRKKHLKTIIATIIISCILASGYVWAGDEAKKINLNMATVKQLESVPGISKRMAQKIIEHRETYGGFTVMEELLVIDVIDTDVLNNLKKYMEVTKIEDCGC
jgi:DNA uptake protein ComE-like DNA-binding protein